MYANENMIERIFTKAKEQTRNVLILCILTIFLVLSLKHSYLLFHIFVELFSVVIAFSLFTITWNSRKNLDNQYLFFIGIAALFIGILDTFHVVTYEGMNIFPGQKFYANQFWLATRFIESLAILIGFVFLKREKKINQDLFFVILSVITLLIILSILYWEIFPVCYIKNVGQTKFKIFSEYLIILILILSLILLNNNKHYFQRNTFKLLVWSIVFAIITEFCFTLYVSNFGLTNQIGHFSKLITFFLIYKANIEVGFLKPTEIIFRKLKKSEEGYHSQSIELSNLNKELKSTNKKIQTLNESLATKNEMLRESNMTKDKLFSIIAHDLRSPFNNILGFSELLIEKGNNFKSSRSETYLNIINSSANDSLILLDNLLNWAKSQTGTINIKPIKLILSNVILEVIKLEKSIANVKNISLNYFTSDEIVVYADENMLKIVLRNLISNAIKFTKLEGEIGVYAISKQDWVEITISDNGIGMNEEKLKELFKLSSDASTLGTAKEKGSGLGLILCKEFVEKHNGKIWAESKEGKGSDFKFTLPLKISD